MQPPPPCPWDRRTFLPRKPRPRHTCSGWPSGSPPRQQARRRGPSPEDRCGSFPCRLRAVRPEQRCSFLFDRSWSTSTCCSSERIRPLSTSQYSHREHAGKPSARRPSGSVFLSRHFSRGQCCRPPARTPLLPALTGNRKAKVRTCRSAPCSLFLSRCSFCAPAPGAYARPPSVTGRTGTLHCRAAGLSPLPAAVGTGY